MKIDVITLFPELVQAIAEHGIPRRAIEAAQKAFETWKKTTANERSKLLRKLHDLILETRPRWDLSHDHLP